MMSILTETEESIRDLTDCLEHRVLVLSMEVTAKEALRALSLRYRCSCKDCHSMFDSWIPELTKLVDELEPINSDRLAKLLESWTNIRKKLREANAS